MAITFGCPLVGTEAELSSKVLKKGQRAYATDAKEQVEIKKLPLADGSKEVEVRVVTTPWKTGKEVDILDENGEPTGVKRLLTFFELPYDVNYGGDDIGNIDLSSYLKVKDAENTYAKISSLETEKEKLERLNYYGNKDIVPTNNNYFVFGDGTVSIAASSEAHNLSSIVLPYKDNNGSFVTKMYDFYGLGFLHSIIIPNTILEIGDYTFSNCSSLRNVIIPDSVTKIGLEAFFDCTNLTKIIIPDSVTSIGTDAFGLIDNLTIICNPGSTAEAYAKENGIKYAYNYTESNIKIITLDVEILDGGNTIKGINPSMTYDEAYNAFMEGKQVYMQGNDDSGTLRLFASHVNNRFEYIKFLSLIEIGIGVTCLEATYWKDGTVDIRKGVIEQQNNRVDVGYEITEQYPDSYPSTIATYDFVKSEIKPLLERIAQLEQQLAELKNNN